MRIALCVSIVLALAAPAAAMNVKVSGNQLVLSGPVNAGDFTVVADALKGNPEIKTLVLRNSPGGDVPTGYQVGELARKRELRTAVSGFCNSSCSRMFLGGKERVFTDDFPADRTRVGFHGHYNMTTGQLNEGQVQRMGLRQWIIAHSDGLADPALVDRWIAIPVNRGFMHFFHPSMTKVRPASTYMCERGVERGRTIFGCETIPKTALDVGVITSLEIISSNDKATLGFE
jgi:hypothetical protein